MQAGPAWTTFHNIVNMKRESNAYISSRHSYRFHPRLKIENKMNKTTFVKTFNKKKFAYLSLPCLSYILLPKSILKFSGKTSAHSG